MDNISGKQLAVPQSIYAFQLNGKGGVQAISDKTLATAAQPCWIHLDYQQPESLAWLNETELLPTSFKEALSGESCRPRISRQGEGTLMILRSINSDGENLSDPLITLRIYITDNLVISSRHRPIEAIDETLNDLQKNIGPKSVGSWLVDIFDGLTNQTSNFIDTIHGKIMELEDGLLDQHVPEKGTIALIRQQLITLRRHLMPQRDVFSRLANERFSWMSNEDRHRMQDIADRLGRGLDDLDATVARTTVLVDEIKSLLADALNRRIYTMSLMAMLFLPVTFLTGLFGVNLGGLPGAAHPYAFPIFCGCLLGVLIGILVWLKMSKWM